MRRSRQSENHRSKLKSKETGTIILKLTVKSSLIPLTAMIRFIFPEVKAVLYINEFYAAPQHK